MEARATPPTLSPEPSPFGDPEHGLSVLVLLSVLLRRSRLVVGLPLGAAVTAAVIAEFLPSTYSATTTFVPEATQQSRLPSDVAGLAGQLGIQLRTEATQSPRFYAEVLKSRSLLEQVLADRYPDPQGRAGDSTTLLRLLSVSGRDSADSVQKGIKVLQHRMSVKVDNLTNIVRV